MSGKKSKDLIKVNQILTKNIDELNKEKRENQIFKFNNNQLREELLKKITYILKCNELELSMKSSLLKRKKKLISDEDTDFNDLVSEQKNCIAELISVGKI